MLIITKIYSYRIINNKCTINIRRIRQNIDHKLLRMDIDCGKIFKIGKREIKLRNKG